MTVTNLINKHKEIISIFKQIDTRINDIFFWKIMYLYVNPIELSDISHMLFFKFNSLYQLYFVLFREIKVFLEAPSRDVLIS